MEKLPFVIEKNYRAPVEKVWKAISDSEDMKKWYFDIHPFRPEVGFEFQFYGGTEEKQYLHKCRIVEVVPGRKLSYSWQYDGFPGYSVVTFELFPEGDQTRLRLTHEGLETFPHHHTDFARANFEAGWSDITGKMLKEYVEQ